MQFPRLRRAAASVARALAAGLLSLAALAWPAASVSAAEAATVRIWANLRVEVRDAASGDLLQVQERRNLVVNAGLNLLRDRIYAGTSNALSYFAVGTGTTAAAASQTALVTEVHRSAVSVFTPDAQRLTVKYYLSSTEANGSTLAEAGIFNAASTGTMFARALLSSTIAKTSAITVTFSWDINFAAT